MKKTNLIILIFLITVFIFSGCNNSTTLPVSCKTDPNILKIHFIDVGQGDSELIQVNNKNLLIDAGTTESTNSLINYLKKQDISKLDYIVATHPHEDHIGGMAKVIKTFKIGDFYAPKVTTNTKTFENMINALNKKNKKIITAKLGTSIDLGNDVKCEILSPISKKYDNDLNLYSAVVKITFGNTKFIFMGDAQKFNENELLSKNLDISADVLKVGHHGSHTSTSSEFLNKVSPKIAVISCGINNDYGHPHKETLDALKKAKCTIYRTDKNGTIIIESDGKNISKK